MCVGGKADGPPVIRKRRGAVKDRQGQSDAAMRRFMRRVWSDDVAPLLRGRLEGQRRKGAAIGGTAAAAGGSFLDGLFKLKGKPFTRAFTVLGATIGAIVPDAWDWDWVRTKASDADRKTVDDAVRRQAAALPETEALELFDLEPTSAREELQLAWRAMSLRWHPDKAPDDARRREFSIRFIAYKTAYERLCEAYEAGRLPVATAPSSRASASGHVSGTTAGDAKRATPETPIDPRPHR